MHVEAVIALLAVGLVAWAVARRERPGRRHEKSHLSSPQGYGLTAEGVAGSPVGPDDDPDFLAGLHRGEDDEPR